MIPYCETLTYKRMLPDVPGAAVKSSVADIVLVGYIASEEQATTRAERTRSTSDTS